MSKKLVHFDWAIKKLLRQKANYEILEGFLSELLKFDVSIESILESESNKETEYAKFNRVDILARTEQNELVLIEIQNDPELDYFHRMLYGVAKLVTEYIHEAQAYGTIKKVISINIVYFGLGQGADYIYTAHTNFVGMHRQDTLQPSSLQQDKYKIRAVKEIFPQYYILKVNNFDDIAKDTLDEWIYFLKNSEVKDEFKAKGLRAAKEKLQYEQLTPSDKRMYESFKTAKMIEYSVTETAKIQGIAEGEQNKTIEIAKNAIQKGYDNTVIADLTGLSIAEIQAIRRELK
jgi:predicted transposase/invertase (TIGR01784 family)